MDAINPYYPNDDGHYVPCAFVGRADAYSRINQFLTDPNNVQAAAFVGQAHIGKSAFLWHFKDVFDDKHIGVYVPLKQLKPENDDQLMQGLMDFTLEAVQSQRILTVHLPSEPDFGSYKTWRDWFSDEFLPDLLRTIRSHRRIVLLIDDIDVLVDGIRDKRFSDDLFTYFSDMLEAHGQLGMAFTLSDEREADVDGMFPLTELSALYRLDDLTIDEASVLMQIPSIYTLTDQALETAYQLTGGVPLLLQRLGDQIYRHVEETRAGQDATGEVYEVTHETVSGFISPILALSSPLFHEMWNDLTLNERLVLTAISSLTYHDPLNPVLSDQVETWLVETDYPLDDTTTKSAIRGLEYKHILRRHGEGVRIRTGIMQNWLLAHARLESPSMMSPAGEQAQSRNVTLLTIVIVMVVIGLLVLMIAVLQSGQLARSNSGTDDVPATVTLESPVD